MSLETDNQDSQPSHLSHPHLYSKHHHQNRIQSLSPPLTSITTSATPQIIHSAVHSHFKRFPAGQSPPFSPTTPAPTLDHQTTQSQAVSNILNSSFHSDLTPASSSLSSTPTLTQSFYSQQSSLLPFQNSLNSSTSSQSVPPSASAIISLDNKPTQKTSLRSSSPYQNSHTPKPIKKPPPISITPTLRKYGHQQPSISEILLSSLSTSSRFKDSNTTKSQHQHDLFNQAGKELEIEERLAWELRTGRNDTLSMKFKNSNQLPMKSFTNNGDDDEIDQSTHSQAFEGIHYAIGGNGGGRDRWGNRWGLENHVLSPVISERTEPTHTSVSSPSTPTLSSTTNPSLYSPRSPTSTNNSTTATTTSSYHNLSQTSNPKQVLMSKKKKKMRPPNSVVSQPATSALPSPKNSHMSTTISVVNVSDMLAKTPVPSNRSFPCLPEPISTTSDTAPCANFDGSAGDTSSGSFVSADVSLDPSLKPSQTTPGHYPQSIPSISTATFTSATSHNFDQTESRNFPVRSRSRTDRRASISPHLPMFPQQQEKVYDDHSNLNKSFASKLARNLNQQIQSAECHSSFQHGRETLQNSQTKSSYSKDLDHLKKKEKKKDMVRQRDLEFSNRQLMKRLEKERRDKMIETRDLIVRKLLETPNDANLVKELGKLYLNNHCELSSFPSTGLTATTEATSIKDSIFHSNFHSQDWLNFHPTHSCSRSEPSLKLSIHYLEQSIQLNNRDPETWLYLGKAWALLLAYPTSLSTEREQRLSNASLGFKKAIMISSTTLNRSSSPKSKIRQTNRYRLAYANHLESLKKYREAAEILQEALEKDQSDAICWRELGRMMELWAFEEEDFQLFATGVSKEERLERMRHSCEAYRKAVELEPENRSFIQTTIEGGKALQKLKDQVGKQNMANSVVQGNEVERNSTLGQNQVTDGSMTMGKAAECNKVESVNASLGPQVSKQAHLNSRSAREMRKLVGEIMEIPKFGQKPGSPSFAQIAESIESQARSLIDVNRSNEQNHALISCPIKGKEQQPLTKTNLRESADGDSIACLSIQLHNSQPTKLVSQPNVQLQPGMSLPLSTAQETIDPPEPSQLSPPIAKKIHPHSAQPDQSKILTYSNSPQHRLLQTPAAELHTSALEPIEQQSAQIESHQLCLSRQPPSPSALPVPPVQASCIRIGTPTQKTLPEEKTASHMAFSPQQAAGVGKRKGKHLSQFGSLSLQSPITISTNHRRSPSGFELDIDKIAVQEPGKEAAKSNSMRINEIQRALCQEQSRGNIDGVEWTKLATLDRQNQYPSPSQSQKQHVRQVAHSIKQPQLVTRLNVPVDDEEHEMDLQESSRQAMMIDSTGRSFRHQPQQLQQLSSQSQISASHLDIPLQSSWQDLESDRMGPPPKIPPRPPSCQTTTRSSVNTTSNYESSPFSPHQLHSVNARRASVSNSIAGAGTVSLGQNLLKSNRPDSRDGRGGEQKVLSLPRAKTARPFDKSQDHHHLRARQTAGGGAPLDNSKGGVYNYSLIDAHLQSIVDIDKRRREEMKELKKQFERTDEWAELRRREVIDELRKLCGSVAGGGDRISAVELQAPLIHNRLSDGASEDLTVEGKRSVNNHYPQFQVENNQWNERRSSSAIGFKRAPQQDHPILQVDSQRHHQSTHYSNYQEASMISGDRPKSGIGSDSAGHAINGIASIIQLLQHSQ
ncbi:hypothetical protein O181_023701 [Austropuccinia psidii MF-1]|uniref:Uncharacterized protein n=1 Tax=Austropuccinia psidii MF-1 TaxID=1389203 RepID=A0A9Q3GXX0_9BASI|nr:hypothetical protein [Austropuccinia psidii MF-1]